MLSDDWKFIRTVSVEQWREFDPAQRRRAYLLLGLIAVLIGEAFAVMALIVYPILAAI